MGILSYIEDHSTVIDIIIWIASLVSGLYAEYKYNIFNRFNRMLSNFQNKQAEISLAFRYKHNDDFDEIKSIFKKSFLDKYPNYHLLNERKNRIGISFDVFTIEIIYDEFGEIFLEVLKTGCGIKDLKQKVEKFLSILDEVNKINGTSLEFISCDISLSLPYKWKFVKIYEPKGFSLKSYRITMQKSSGFASDIEIYLDSINASLKSTAEISYLLDNIL